MHGTCVCVLNICGGRGCVVVHAMSAPTDKAFFKKLAESIRAERRLREAEREAAAAEVRALQQRLEGMDGLNHRQLSLLRHALRHSGFRYTVLSHQNSHGVSHQTARSDLQKLATRGLLTAGKDGRREVFRVPEDLAMRLPG